MTTRIVRITSRPFQALFNDADYHLKSAQEYLDILTKGEPGSTSLPDQGTVRCMAAHCRACVLSAITGIEAFANSVIQEFSARALSDLPQEWIPERLRTRSETLRWPIKAKVKFLPAFCNQKPISPDNVFPSDDDVYRLFCELVDVRNSMAHGKLASVEFRVTLRPNRIHLIDDRIPENFWPLSQIPRDIFEMRVPDASLAYDNMTAILRRLILNLDCEMNRAFYLDQQAVSPGREGEYKGQRFLVRRESSYLTEPKWYQLITKDGQ